MLLWQGYLKIAKIMVICHFVWLLQELKGDLLPSLCVLWPVAILFGCHGKSFKVGNLWSTSRERRPCEGPAVKSLWGTSRKKRPLWTTAGKEDPVAHWQNDNSIACLLAGLVKKIEKWLNYLQTVETLIRCHILRHLIRVSTVCQLPFKGLQTTIG